MTASKPAKLNNNGSNVVLHDAHMRQLFDGRTYVAESELSRDMLMRLLFLRKSIERVSHIFEVEVLTMAGESFKICMDKAVHNRVKRLKREMQKVEGTSIHFQDMFRFDQNANNPLSGTDPLSNLEAGNYTARLKDDDVISGPCNFLMCLKVESHNMWDITSPSGVDVEFSGDDNQLARRCSKREGDAGLIMTAGPPLMPGTGKHVLSVKLSTGQTGTYVGLDALGLMQEEHIKLLRDGGTKAANNTAATCQCSCKDGFSFCRGGKEWFGGRAGSDGCKAVRGWTVPLYTPNWSGEHGEDLQIKSGQTVTMELDTDNDTLSFWVDGEWHCSGVITEVGGGPLRWVAAFSNLSCFDDSAIEIVSDPRLQPGWQKLSQKRAEMTPEQVQEYDRKAARWVSVKQYALVFFYFLCVMVAAAAVPVLVVVLMKHDKHKLYECTEPLNTTAFASSCVLCDSCKNY